MDLDVALDRLPAQAIAHYGWGHYRIWLSAEAAAQPQDFALNTVVQVNNGAATWADDREFACFVSLLHEFVHYQQDVGTGCGHWDELARRSMLSSVLYEARNQSWFPDQPLPLPAAQAQTLADRYASASVFNLYRRRRTHSLELIRAELVDSPAYTEGAEADLSVDALLELDAVLAVLRVVPSIRSNAAGLAIVRGQRHLWQPLQMGPAYARPYELMIEAFRRLLFGSREDLDRSDAENLLNTMEYVVPLLLDIALAHPPPSYFTGDREDDRDHFEPGVRLVRALRALASAEDQQLKEPDADVERLVRLTPAYAYPDVPSIYQAWAEEFSKRAAEDPIAAWRLQQCESRLKKPHGIERRDLRSLITHDIPLVLDSPSWPSARLLLTGRHLADDGALYHGLRQAVATLSLAQWFLGGSPGGFVCPHAEKQWCDHVRTTCRSGMAHVWHLPKTANCEVHASLDHWGFQLDPPLR